MVVVQLPETPKNVKKGTLYSNVHARGLISSATIVSSGAVCVCTGLVSPVFPIGWIKASSTTHTTKKVDPRTPSGSMVTFVVSSHTSSGATGFLPCTCGAVVAFTYLAWET